MGGELNLKSVNNIDLNEEAKVKRNSCTKQGNTCAGEKNCNAAVH